MKFTTFIVALALSGPASAAVLNGNFQTGTFAGYTTDQSGGGGAPFGDFASVETSGTNAYAQLTTGSAAQSLSYAAIFQDISISLATSYLTFDALLVGDETDPIAGSSPFQDNVTFYMFDEIGNYIPIFGFVGGAAGGIDPFGSSATAAAIAALAAPSDPFFGTGVTVDLTDYVGQTVQLGLLASAYNDGRIVTGAFDNITLTAPPAVVPLPATLPLALLALAAFPISRRRPRV